MQYYTPERISKWNMVKITERSYCPKCKLYAADVVHMFIKCPKLKDYWDSLSELITVHTGIQTNLSDKEIMLGDKDGLPPSLRALIIIIIVSARLCVARSWIDPTPPKVSEIWTILCQIYEC